MNRLQLAWNYWRQWHRRFTFYMSRAHAQTGYHLAMRKRRLEAVCRQSGASRAIAKRIASTYFNFTRFER